MQRKATSELEQAVVQFRILRYHNRLRNIIWDLKIKFQWTSLVCVAATHGRHLVQPVQLAGLPQFFKFHKRQKHSRQLKKEEYEVEQGELLLDVLVVEVKRKEN